MTRLKVISERRHTYISRSDNVRGKISRYPKYRRTRPGHKGPVNRQKLDKETFIGDSTNSGRGDSLREHTLDHWGYIKRKEVIADIIHVLAGKDEDTIPIREKWEEELQYSGIGK